MITALKTYKPKFDSSRCRVTVTRKGFSFSAIARDALRLREIAFMRIHTDPDKRLIVFEPVPGLNKQSDVLKVGHDRSARVAAKGLISEEPWIKAVAAMPGEARKFEMKEYHGQLPPPESGNRKQEMPP